MHDYSKATARAAAKAYIAADRSMTWAWKDARMAAMAYKSTDVYAARYARAEHKAEQAYARLVELRVCVDCALGYPQACNCLPEWKAAS